MHGLLQNIRFKANSFSSQQQHRTHSIMLWRFVVVVLALSFAQIECQKNLNEGDVCQTPNDEAGKCTSIYKCEVLLALVRSNSSETYAFLRESQCGRIDNTPLVCCGTKSTYETAPDSNTEEKPRAATVDLEGRYGVQRNPLPDRRICGLMVNEDRIFFGEVTAKEEFPWMAVLEYRRRDGSVTTLCGGSLIGKRYILTAAHCLVGEVLNYGTPFRARLGEFDTTTDPDCTLFKNWKECADPVQRIEFAQTFVHDRYLSNAKTNRWHDIALIKLKEDARYSDYVRPICLPEFGESSAIGRNLTVAGWGKTETGRSSSVKLKVTVPVASKRTCRRVYSNLRFNLGESQICAGGDHRDSCRGDSGGPLMARTLNRDDQWYLEGIVSFGLEQCGQPGWPAIYTKVESYLDWINERVN